jgi:Tfp pilus assembly protein PilO
MSQFQFFTRLNSSERRFVVAVALILFIGANWFWVVPHFSDLSNYRQRLRDANKNFESRQRFITETERLKPEVGNMLREGGGVLPEEQSLQFVRTIQSQAVQSGVNLVTSSGLIISTNDPFFNEASQNITVTGGEKQLVDFLYNLGKGNSQIRVRALSLRPDTPRQQLNASITLVASYKRDQSKKIASASTPAPNKPTTPTPAAKPTTPATNQPGKPTIPQTKPTIMTPSGPVTRTLPPSAALTNRPTMPKPTPIKK